MFSFEYTEVYVVMLLVNVIIKHSQHSWLWKYLALETKILCEVYNYPFTMHVNIFV